MYILFWTLHWFKYSQSSFEYFKTKHLYGVETLLHIHYSIQLFIQTYKYRTQFWTVFAEPTQKLVRSEPLSKNIKKIFLWRSIFHIIMSSFNLDVNEKKTFKLTYRIWLAFLCILVRLTSHYICTNFKCMWSWVNLGCFCKVKSHEEIKSPSKISYIHEL